jgi:alpha-tubulin suppressor-like RCC1 family protein
VLLLNGEIHCWGGNNEGQLGDGTQINRPTPAQVAIPVAATQLAGGQDFFCSAHVDDSVWCWGNNSGAQTGITATGNARILSPRLVGTIAGIVELAAGADHVCALLNTGAVTCWGENGQGQLGRGSTIDSPVPTVVNGVSNAVQISLGENHTCARTAAGQAICWGDNVDGQMSTGGTTDVTSATPLNGFPAVVDLTTGDNFTCGVVASGGVVCVGNGDDGQFARPATTTNYTSPVTLPGVTGVSRIVGASSANFLIAADGSVRSLGGVFWGQLGIGQTLRPTSPVLAPY